MGLRRDFPQDLALAVEFFALDRALDLSGGTEAQGPWAVKSSLNGSVYEGFAHDCDLALEPAVSGNQDGAGLGLYKGRGDCPTRHGGGVRVILAAQLDSPSSIPPIRSRSSRLK